MKEKIKKFLKPRNFIFLILLLVMVSLGFYFWQKRAPKIPFYIEYYRLVPEKISQSAQIRINLPPKVNKEFAKQHIKFEPEIKGKWIEQKSVLNKILDFAFAAENSNYLLFKPDEKLQLNHYYLVKLTLPDEGEIKADFLAVEDPEIVAIFPKENSESPEDTEITIVFNRPMVPLTTLGKLEEKEIPVEITPKTEGHFKWISTNVLQFIPKERLVRSSNYTVKVKSGMVSMDGLPVNGKEIKFQTRKLRYLQATEGIIIYNQPISIYFNQPVDLERTKKEITLINNATGKEIPFVAEYKSKEKETTSQTEETFNITPFKKFLAQIARNLGFKIGPSRESKEEKIDQSVIEIYQKEDRFGREKLWDFETSYTLKINKAYPLEGDIILDAPKSVSVRVTGIIESVSAESSRTEYATADFFDPKGKIWVSFYEEINLEKSKISAPKLKEIGYGQKCKEEKEIISEDVECEKIPDKKKIYLTFKGEEIGFEEKIDIKFEKIVNTQGLTINKEPIIKTITSYPKFKVFKTSPENNSSNVNLTKLIICSNTPILVPAKEDYGKYFKSNLDYEIKDWGGPWRVEQKFSQEICDPGQFHTSIFYGLMPNADYSLNLDLKDVFGQKQTLSLNFKTGDMPSFALNFYHLQRGYNVTTPEKTKLTFAVENMEYVNVDICKLSGKDFLYYLLNQPTWYEGPEHTINCQERIRDKIELPKKYWIKNYFQFDIKDYFENPIGDYILTFSHPNYKGSYLEGGREIFLPVYERSYLTVTNLGVAEKKISPEIEAWGEREPLTSEKLKELKNLYWVVDLRNLEPVSGAKIDLYRKVNGNLFLSESIFTGEDGLSFTTPTYDLAGIVVSKDQDSTVLFYQSKLEWAEMAYSARKIYLYTDKPIYRPGQEVFIKGIYRVGYDGNYEIFREKPINLKVFNSKGNEIFNQDLEISEFGTFNTRLILENNAPLGTYRVCAKEYSCTYFEVLEYVPAPFKVELKTDKEEYVAKDTFNLDVEAKYYFGIPLESGEVEYTISSQNYYFDRYKDEYFDFGQGWYYWPPYEFGEKFILRGKTQLNEEGKAKISQVLDFEKWFKEEERKSKIIVVDITVKNSLGQSVSAQKSFIVHQGEFYLGLKADKYFVGKNEKFNLKVKSVNIQGKEIKVNDVQLNLYKINWLSSKRQEATGGYSYQWEKKRELVKSFNFDTDTKGNYNLELQIEKEGEYEAEVKAKDKKGNLISSVYEIYVWGEGQASIRPTSETELKIESEKTDLKIGEEGKLIIKSPYSLAKALISIERGKIFDYQIKEIKGNLYPFSFVAKKEYLPNVFVSVLLISSKPEVKFGKVEFYIDRKEKELDIEVKSNKKFYLPGEEVTLEILTKDSDGKGVSAEVSVAVVDLSVLALKGNPKKNPLIFFYGGFPLTVQTASNIKNILVETKISTKGGGGMAEDLAIKKRGIFKETAFWEAAVRTNEEGKAEVKFTLPDNLTTWQVESVGVTKDTKVGVNYLEFLTKKELMAIPFKPRFVVPGDEFFVGAQIFNQTKETQKVKVKFESQTLILKERNSEKEIKIKPEKSETVYFKVQTPPQIKSGDHKFVISAIAQSLQDVVEQSIKINPDNTYEVTASSNYTPLSTFKEYLFLPENIEKDRGELTIKVSATLANFLSDALNYLLQYPYGCSEQIASKLNAIAIVKRGLNLPNIKEKFKLEKIKYQGKEFNLDEVVEIGLNELYNNQQFDGGFSFWRGGKSDFHLTLYVIETLQNLKLAGFKVNENSLQRAAQYAFTKITEDPNLFQNKENIILTAYILLKLPNFQGNEILKTQIVQIVNDDKFLQEEISNTSLAHLAILLNYGFDEELKNKIYNILENKIKIDGRGAFLETSKNFNWQYYETPIKNTALYLKAEVARKSENPILEKVLRWLLNSKWKDGSWGSTQNTLSVIDAFTDYLERKRETKSNFALEILVNEKSEGKFDFNPETIFDQFKKEIPIQNLKFNEINTILFQKTNRNKELNAYYYDLALRYYLPANQIAPRDEGFSITRGFYSLEDKKNQNPLKKGKVGEVLRTHLQITVPKSRNFVIVEDFIPAGMEIVNLDLSTEQKSLRLQEKELTGRELIPDFKEIHDDRVFLYIEHLEPGVYEFDYFVRPLIKGKFIHLSTQVSEMYFPENFGRTSGDYFEIE
jgi:uncharacterized protein YfaS (alpha-2-macroglobulin family)